MFAAGPFASRNQAGFGFPYTFGLDFANLGSGAVSTAEYFGTTATFTRATAASSKLSTGLWKLDVASGTARYTFTGLDTTVATTGGYFAEGARTNSALQARDLTNAAWTKSNLTTAKTSTGIDGVGSSCTRCTASAANGTALQAVTLASAAKAFGVWIKRITGTGEIDITLDNGATWNNITANINASTFTLVQATQTLANPTVGVRVVTSGDAIDVDVAQLEDGASFISSPVATTVAAVTRNADVLTYPGSPWFSATAGTIYAEVMSEFTTAIGNVIFGTGASSEGMSIANTLASTTLRFFDSTNASTAVGLTDISTGKRKRVVAYSGTTVALTGDGAAVTAGVFDGSLDGTTIGVGANPANGLANFFGTISSIRYFPFRLPNGTLQLMTT